MTENLALQQARIALQMYVQRGYKAIQLIEAGDFDGALGVLQWRDAAFHNFRAADKVLSDAGIDIASDDHCAETYAEILPLNESLQLAIESMKNRQNSELKNTIEHRGKVGKFRSKSESRRAVQYRI